MSKKPGGAARLALRLLTFLVPRGLRERWIREWQGELTHWRSGTASFLLAAARDTLSVRALHVSETDPHPDIHAMSPRERIPVRQLLQDLRFAFRALRKAPWFSLATVLTLALGIGASVAMFGILNRVFLAPLPFPDAGRLVLGRTTVDGHLNPWVAGADYYDYRDQTTGFEELAAILPFPTGYGVTGGGEAERAPAGVASVNLFGALGVRPALGRDFRQEDGLEGAANVVMISQGFWKRHFGGDPKVVGRSLSLNSEPYTVVGVLPAGFFFMYRADLWIPLRPDRFMASARDMYNWYLVGRMRPGVTRVQAQAETDLVSARLARAYPQTNRNRGLLLTSLHEALVEDYRPTLLILTAAVALVLLIACGNGAGILLARAPARTFELSVRSALGAPRARLVRQLLAESLGLALAGGLLGTILAAGLQQMMLTYLQIDRLAPMAPGLSWTGMAAALGLSLFAGVLAGAYPALRGTGAALGRGMKTGERRMGERAAGFRATLVVAQVALSVVLLAASGLLVRSLANLQALDPGFDSRDVLTARIWVPTARYPEAGNRIRFYTSLLDGVRALPGVSSAALGSHVPIVNSGNIYRATAVGEGTETGKERIFLRASSPGYFATMGIPLRAGRGIQPGDDAGSRPVVVLSETAARRFFGEESPLGKQVQLEIANPLRMVVVGVVGDVRLSSLENAPEAAFYVPFAQRATSVMSVVLKTRVPPASLAAPLRELVKRMDPDIPLSGVATVADLVSRSMSDRKVLTLSLTLFALFPLLLAAVGLFAILAYHVSRRRHEIGVRMALGAQATRIGGMVLRRSLVLVGVGTVLGLGGALAVTRFLRSQLFGVGTTDPVTLAGVVVFVAVVSLAASAAPTWRAVQSDPRVALQAE